MNIIFWVMGGIGSLLIAPKEYAWIVFLVVMMTAVIAQTIEKVIAAYVDIEKEKYNAKRN